MIQPQCHHTAFRTAADGTGQVQIRGAQRSFLARAGPAFETDVAFLFQQMGLFLQPCHILRFNAGVPLGVIFGQILLHRGQFPHGTHQASLDAVQHLHRPGAYPGMAHHANQGI